MHRTQLITLLNAYYPAASEEREAKQTMLEFIQNNPDCFKRSLAIGHITASAWLLDVNGSHALLMHHAKLNRWVQLGGHCDGDSDVLAVALKEAREESGIQGIEPVSRDIFDIDIHLIPDTQKEKAHYHYDVRFLLCVTSDEPAVHNSESKELRWVSKDLQALPTQSRSVVRMFDKWCAMKVPLNSVRIAQSQQI